MPSSSRSFLQSALQFGRRHWVLTLLLVAASSFLLQQNVADFRVSVISTPAPAFDGTALPIEKSPKWTALSNDEWDQSYDQIPVSKMQLFPTYNPNELKISSDQLGWSDAADLAIRNAKITFSVPYMGNYKLDGHEYAGSHLAVDIKVPMNTPIYAIANGVVTKASTQTTGFGNHIVVRHDNVPSFEGSGTETYFSSYSHLNQVLVEEGDVVLRGQLIGKSGETGTATTPHLHFQIDNSSAPWHPYWPFTFQEASDAGLDFTSAINTGFHQQQALDTTINPLMFVQKHLGAVSSTPVETTPTPEPEETTPTELPPAPEVESESTSEEPLAEAIETEVAVGAVAFIFEAPEVFTKGESQTITVQAVDSDGEPVLTYRPNGYVEIKLLAGNADIPDLISRVGFSGGAAQFTVTPTSDAPVKLFVTDGKISGESGAMDSAMFHDVAANSEYFKSVSFLKEHEVIGGYPDGSFKPNNVVSRVEALKFILNGINSELLSATELPFSDTSTREWYSGFVATAYDRSIVNGYPDTTFRPANTVNKVEFLKMLLLAMDVELDTNIVRDVYPDVPRDAWFAPYVKFAKDKNLIAHDGGLFNPDAGMTRGEVANLIYRLIVLKVSGADQFSTGIQVSEGDVTRFFN